MLSVVEARYLVEGLEHSVKRAQADWFGYYSHNDPFAPELLKKVHCLQKLELKIKRIAYQDPTKPPLTDTENDQ